MNARKQGGFIISWEMCCALFGVFCLWAICSATIGTAVVGEYHDIAQAIGSMNQSYTITGIAYGHPNDPNHPTDLTRWEGSSYVDTTDFCDAGGNCGVQVCVPPAPEQPPDDGMIPP